MKKFTFIEKHDTSIKQKYIPKKAKIEFNNTKKMNIRFIEVLFININFLDIFSTIKANFDILEIIIDEPDNLIMNITKKSNLNNFFYKHIIKGDVNCLYY